MAITVSTLGTANGGNVDVAVLTFTYSDGLVASAGDWIIICGAKEDYAAACYFYDSSTSKRYYAFNASYVNNTGNVASTIALLKLPVDTGSGDYINVEYWSAVAQAATFYKATNLDASRAPITGPSGAIERHLYSGSYIRGGGIFPRVKAGTLSQIDVRLKKYGSPTGTYYVRVRSAADGTLLGTMRSADVSTLGTSWAYVACTDDVTIPSEQDIEISIEYSGGDASNYLDWNASVLTASGDSLQFQYDSAYVLDGYSELVFQNWDGPQVVRPDDKVASATGSGNNPKAGPTATLSQANELGIGLICMEEEDDEAGTWVTGASHVSGNAQIVCNNQGGAKSVTAMSVAEVLSATTAQNVEQTATGSNDWAALVHTFKEGAGGVQVTPAPAEAAASAQSPGVVLGSTSCTPAHAAGVASGQDPGVVLGSMTVTPAQAEATASAQSPGVILGSIEIAPAEALAVASGQDPGVFLGSTSCTPAQALGVASGQDPIVVLGSIYITPAVALAAGEAIDPVVEIGGITLTPAYAGSIASLVDPAVILGSIEITPAVALALASGQDPVVLLGSTSCTPAAVLGVASAIDPTVQTGGITLTPAYAEALASAINPDVVLGSLALSPAEAPGVASGQDPLVVLGSIALTPAVVLGVASAINPTVQEGGISITPAHAPAVGSLLDPAVFLGSTSCIPAVILAVALAINPNVIEGGTGPTYHQVALTLLNLGVGGRRKN